MSLSETTYHLEYGQHRIPFRLRYSNRKTLGISVYPDERVVVTAPHGASEAKIWEKLHKRAAWILKQLRYFQDLSYQPKKRSYAAGSTHAYLGRHYRLKLIETDEPETVKLKGKYFQVFTSDKNDESRTAKLMEQWYRQKARQKFGERFEACLQRLAPDNIREPQWRLQYMPKRWGSFTPSSTILLNPILVEKPLFCIDYVIIHELCHAVHPNHSRDYYAFLEQVLPDWRRRKGVLEGDR